MLISTETDFLSRRFGEEDAIRMLARAGFDAYDYSQFAMLEDASHPMNQPDYADYIRHLRQVADDCGIVCNQSHAPYPSSWQEQEKTDAVFQKLIRSMEAAAMLGAKVIVVHPMQHLRYLGNEDTLRKMNIDFYQSLIPYARQFGIRIATENMWQYERHVVHSCCSRPEEFCDYIDSANSPWLVACLDVGHASLVHQDLSEMIHKLGRNRLQALHVHDTDYIADLHTLPFMAKMDFKVITDALHDIGYEGDLTLEASTFCDRVPDGLIPSALRFMADAARYLADCVQGTTV